MRRSPQARTAAAVLLLLLAGSAQAFAADPSAAPSVAPSEVPGDTNVQVWLDEALPPDVPVGRTITVGFTAWDLKAHDLSRVNSAEVLVHPKTGKAAPTRATTRSDWPGHLVADVTIPTGGLGTFEIGFPAHVCHDDTGTCEDLLLPFAFGGVGPPPEAPRSVLVDATIRAIAGPVNVGQPIDLAVELEPRAAWDPAALALPDRMVAIAMKLRGQDLASAELRSTAGPGGPYTGAITIPEAGDAVLVVGFPSTGGQDDIVDRSALRLTVLPPGDADAAPLPSGAPTAASTDPLATVPILPIALVAAAVVAVGFVLRRGLADL